MSISRQADGLILAVNDSWTQLFGHTREEAVGHTSLELRLFVDPGERVSMIAQLQGGWHARDFLMHLRRRSGETRDALVTMKPMTFQSEPYLLAITHDITDQRRAEAERNHLLAREQAARREAEAVADRLSRLQQVTASLAQALTRDQVAQIVVEQGVAALGAQAGSLMVLSEDSQELIMAGSVGYPPELIAAWSRFPVANATPLGDAIRGGEMILLGSLAARAQRYPQLVPTYSRSGGEATASIPLRVDGQVLGGIGLTFGEAREFTEADGTFMLALASQCAQALERARLYEAEQTARTRAETAQARLSFLAEAAVRLTGQLDYEATADALARLVVPTLAEWSVVDVLGPDQTVRYWTCAHVEPAQESLVREMEHRYPRHPHTNPVYASLIATRQASFVSDMTEDHWRLIARDSDHLALLRQLQPRSACLVPLKARERVLGTLALMSSQAGRFGPADLALVEELAYRAALALDNARLYHEARDAVQARDEFLSIASHELRTPLTSLQLLVQTLQRLIQQRTLDHIPPERWRQVLEATEAQLHRLTRLVTDLLDVTRISQGRLELRRTPVDLAALVHEVMLRFDQLLTHSGSTVNLDTTGPTVGLWDASRLDQVVTNLLSNAVKYGAGKPIAIRVEGSPTTVRLTIRDQGIGIPPADHARIFQRFERAAAAQHYEGLGLGLYVARSFVEAHGGAIRVDSAPGQGATFSLELPVEPIPLAADE